MLLTDLITMVQLQSNAVPTNAALIHLQETARRFFRETSVWTTELTIDSVEDQAAYALDLSGEVSVGTTPKVSRIQSVFYNGTEMGTQTYYLRPSDDYLVFNTNYIPNDNVTGGLVVTVSVVPAVDGTDFPQEYVEKYKDGLVGGALYRLMKTPRRPYTDRSSAEDYNLDYKRDFIRARMDVDSEGTERAGGLRTSSQNTGGFFG